MKLYKKIAILAIAILLCIQVIDGKRKRKLKTHSESEIESKHLSSAEVQRKVDECNSKCINECDKTKDAKGNKCTSGYCFPGNYHMCYCWYVENSKRFECDNIKFR